MSGKRHGFTLIEMLIALTIFTIGAVATFVLFPAASMAVRQAREYTDVGMVLDSYLNLALATPFDDLDPAAPRSITTGLPDFIDRVEIHTTQDANPDLKLVAITATYTSKGNTRTETVSTYVANV